MKRHSNGAWGMAALAVLAAMMTGGEARAAGIRITTGTTQPTGDPTYEYIFTVDLLAGSTLDTGGYFTVYDLPGIPSNALTSQPNINWGSSIQDLGLTPAGTTVTDDPTIENVTWEWNGSSPIVAGGSDLFLGTFIVGSTTELPTSPTPTLIYVGSTDGNTASNQSTITVTSVPEPASIVLLSTAAAAALGLALLRGAFVFCPLSFCPLSVVRCPWSVVLRPGLSHVSCLKKPRGVDGETSDD